MFISVSIKKKKVLIEKKRVIDAQFDIEEGKITVGVKDAFDPRLLVKYVFKKQEGDLWGLWQNLAEALQSTCGDEK